MSIFCQNREATQPNKRKKLSIRRGSWCFLLGLLLFALPARHGHAQELEEAIQLSWRNNTAFAIERRRTLEAFETAKRAAIDLGPRFAITGSYGYGGSTYPPGDLSLDPDPTWQASIGVTQPLLQNGQLYSSFLTARFNRAIALIEFRKSEARLILGGVRLYVDTLSAAAAQRLSRKTEEQFQKQFEATSQSARLGQASRREVALAEALVADARAARLATEAQRRIIEQRFINYFGTSPARLSTPENLPAIPAGYEEAHALMIDNNFDLQKARLELRKNRKITNIAVRFAFFLPSINLEAQYGISESVNNFTAVRQRRDNFSVKIGAMYPLAPGRFSSGYRSLLNALKIAEQGARQAREGAEAAIVSAWQNVQSAEKRRNATGDAVKARQIVLESAQQEADLGTGDIDNLLDAERALAEAQRAEIAARGEALYARYAVLETTGTLSAKALGIEVKQYDKAYFSKWGFSVK